MTIDLDNYRLIIEADGWTGYWYWAVFVGPEVPKLRKYGRFIDYGDTFSDQFIDSIGTSKIVCSGGGCSFRWSAQHQAQRRLRKYLKSLEKSPQKANATGFLYSHDKLRRFVSPKEANN